MKLRNRDLIITAYLEANTLKDINEICKSLKIDKSLIYLSLRKLKEHNIVSNTEDRPQKFVVNTQDLEKWKKKN